MAKQTLSHPRSTARSTGARRGMAPANRRIRRSRWFLVAGLLAVVGGIVVVATSLGSRGRHPSAVSGLAVLHTPDYHSLALSPTDPNIVFFGHHNGVMRSDDGGHSFHTLVAQTNFDAMNLAVNPTNTQQVYLAGHEVFQVSTDGGSSWQSMTTNLPDRDIHAFAMNPDDPTHLTAFVVGSGLFASTDAGHTWQRLAGRVPGDLMAVSSAGGSPETLYAASMGSGLLRSTDGGQTFTPVSPTLGRSVYAVAVDPTTRTTVYAGTADGLFKSTTGGTTWSKLPYPGANAAVVGVSRAKPGLVVAINLTDQAGQVERSDDGGLTWNTH